MKEKIAIVLCSILVLLIILLIAYNNSKELPWWAIMPEWIKEKFDKNQ